MEKQPGEREIKTTTAIGYVSLLLKLKNYVNFWKLFCLWAYWLRRFMFPCYLYKHFHLKFQSRRGPLIPTQSQLAALQYSPNSRPCA